MGCRTGFCSRSCPPFLDQVVATQPHEQEIQILRDSLSAHKTKAVSAWLAEHPSVEIRYTPTYSSWLNRVAIWFTRLRRDLLARGISTSANNLPREIMAISALPTQIRRYRRPARPLHWTYKNTHCRIRVNTS